VTDWACRACGGDAGALVLDLGLQPACDYFPRADDAGPDPEYPLQMWLCGRCGLAQLMDDPTVPEEPRAAEPEALVQQAAAAVAGVAAAGLLPDGGTAAEFGSPHGGSWLGLLADRGLKPAADGEPADVVVDCFGLMHDRDQAAAMAERAARTAPGGILLLQFHTLAAIVEQGQWNALRHGHYAYYSTIALTRLLASIGFSPVTAWTFELYGGTVLLAARRDTDVRAGLDGGAGPDAAVTSLLGREDSVGVTDPAALRTLQQDSQARAAGLRAWLTEQRQAGRQVLGYGAASRAIALLRRAGIGRDLLPAVADASPAKQGLRMPGTDIPVVSPAELTTRHPDAVVLFLADLRAEVSAAYPEIEAGGGHWVDADSLGS
jgi:C-methyltransferase C-terminal domain/Putative zinc binding domain